MFVNLYLFLNQSHQNISLKNFISLTEQRHRISVKWWQLTLGSWQGWWSRKKMSASYRRLWRWDPSPSSSLILPSAEEAASRNHAWSWKTWAVLKEDSPGLNAHKSSHLNIQLLSRFFSAITLWSREQTGHTEDICWSHRWAATWMWKPNVKGASLSSLFKNSLSCKESWSSAQTTPICSIL